MRRPAQEMTFVHQHANYSTLKIKAMEKLEKFMQEPQLLGAPYEVNLPVSSESFACFMKAINDDAYEITGENINELSMLCDFF